jgi:hypothetical protein
MHPPKDTRTAEKRKALIEVDVVEERREPRMVTQAGRLGLSVRLVYVPTGEVLWSGSDVERATSFTDSAQSLAGAILGAVKKTWPSSRVP